MVKWEMDETLGKGTQLQVYSVMDKFADNCCQGSVKARYVYAPCCRTEIAQVSKHTATGVQNFRCLYVNSAPQTFSPAIPLTPSIQRGGMETTVDNILLSWN